MRGGGVGEGWGCAKVRELLCPSNGGQEVFDSDSM